jgi:hypothetical protein
VGGAHGDIDDRLAEAPKSIAALPGLRRNKGSMSVKLAMSKDAQEGFAAICLERAIQAGASVRA